MKKSPTKAPTVVSVLNLKGGVGKTTVTALLARYAAYCGLDVLAVDMDPQANLSQALMNTTDYSDFMENKEPSIVELFEGYQPPTDKSPSPSEPQSSQFVKRATVGYFSCGREKVGGGNLEVVPSRFDFSHVLTKAIKLNERMLANFIASHMQHKDLILIDCAPTESVFTTASCHASRYILVPVKTEFFSTIGFPLMARSLDNFRNQNPAHQIDVCGVLIHSTKTRGSGESRDGSDSMADIEAKAGRYGWDIFRNAMDHSDGYPKWAKDPYANWLGNAPSEWPKIADEILAKIGLTSS